MPGIITNVITDVSIMDIVTHMKAVIDENVLVVDEVIKQFQSAEKLNKVWIGDWDTITDFPCVTIEPGGITQAWGATSMTMENRYSATVFCYVKNLNKEVSVKYITYFADIIRRILTHPNNLAWEISDKGSIYDSFIPSIRFGTKKGFALRASQMEYTAVGWNINVTRES